MSTKWKTIKNFTDIKYESGLNNAQGIAKITINRPEVRNAFRPQTVFELKEAFSLAREDQSIGVIILTGEGEHAFCSGGDQKIRGDKGYVGNEYSLSQATGGYLEEEQKLETVSREVEMLIESLNKKEPIDETQ